MQVPQGNPLPSPTEEGTAAALRAQLESELKNKKQCSYVPYECTQLTLEGYAYCLKHILQDKNAPYKQCSFVYTTNGKRCYMAAPKGDKREYGYCSEHALKTTLARYRQNCRLPPPRTAEVLLHSLSHYVKRRRSRTTSSSSTQQDDSNAGETLACTKSLDPFTEVDAATVVNSSCNNVLDWCSESESDIEAATWTSVWHDLHTESSDDESIDSENEDVLKHANVYTAEEVTLVTRDKLIRLQSLYIEQYRHLQYLLKEKRRKYLQALKREKETCCNIYNQVRDNPKEQRLYKKLKAYNKYQRTYGDEAILSKRLHDQRAKITDGIPQKNSSFAKCCFTEGGVKCGERALPMAKHCRKHILEDAGQVLFKACGKIKSDIECSTPVEAIFEDATCKLHMDIPLLRSYSQARKDSESDMDDSLENANMLKERLSEQVKTELSPEIPKMETVPTQLFEEEEDMDFRSNLANTEDTRSSFDILDKNCDDSKVDLNNSTQLGSEESTKSADESKAFMELYEQEEKSKAIVLS